MFKCPPACADAGSAGRARAKERPAGRVFNRLPPDPLAAVRWARADELACTEDRSPYNNRVDPKTMQDSRGDAFVTQNRSRRLARGIEELRLKG
jgi:hypothetical protein